MNDYQKSLRDALKSISLNANWVKGFYRAGTSPDCSHILSTDWYTVSI